MLNNTEIEDNSQFQNLMRIHCSDCINFLLENGIPFSILSHTSHTDFLPKLPKDINDNLIKNQVLVFTLDGYTFSTAQIENNKLKFEAGFGKDNFASIVQVPIPAIIQIIVKDKAIFINVTDYKISEKISNTQKSMSLFRSNPKNQF